MFSKDKCRLHEAFQQQSFLQDPLYGYVAHIRNCSVTFNNRVHCRDAGNVNSFTTLLSLPPLIVLNSNHR